MAFVVMVEDDEDQASSLMRVLRAEGHDVQVAHSTDDGLALLQKRVPDVAIFDVMFPGNVTGGFDLARKVRKLPGFDAMPIIMLTSINQQYPFKFSGKDIDPDWLPVTEFLEKPVDFGALKRTIAAHCTRS